MVLCKTVTKAVETIASDIGINLPENIKTHIADRLEEFLSNILIEADSICIKNKRKIVSVSDLKEACLERDMPFNEILEKISRA